MFTSLPKSELAQQKASKLSHAQLVALDMHFEAAFLRPDSYMEILEVIPFVRNDRLYEVFVVQIDVAIVALVKSALTGRIGVQDFYVTQDLLSASPNTTLV